MYELLKIQTQNQRQDHATTALLWFFFKEKQNLTTRIALFGIQMCSIEYYSM